MSPLSVLKWIDKRKHWWKVFVLIFSVSVAVVGYLGVRTYIDAPPLATFVSEDGATVFTADAIAAGQVVFFRRGLMEHGSFLGDGALRGPDFTAEALHLTARWMHEFHFGRLAASVPDPALREKVAASIVQEELEANRHDPSRNVVTLTNAQVHAHRKLQQYYGEKFGAGGPLAGIEAFRPANYIPDPQDVRDLTAFFYWGGWLCAASRPGFEYSYTHDWPHEPLAGNRPTSGIVIWSVIGALALVLSLGVVLYYHGKLDRESLWEAQAAKTPPLATRELVEGFEPTPTQRACYKYFAVAAILFLVQVLMGLLTIGDFVGLSDTSEGGLAALLPATATRALHVQLSILWVACCWFAATIWVLPLICRPEPPGQLAWVNALFWMLAVVAGGTLVGIPLAIAGRLGGAWRWLGTQGWEFVELGRAFQVVLYAAFVAWLVIVVRGTWPVLRRRQTWSLPNWMAYSIAGIIFMFSAGFVASPETNFVIADFWRWCTIHMWVEAFFELFTTILVAYFLYLMGFVSHAVAARVVYLAAVLFLGSGLIGISHNFYWNGKSIEAVALGGVLSTLQVVPLVLLTFEAWRFRHLPVEATGRARRAAASTVHFGLGDAFLFLVGVNFWNFMGAGVMGFTINLPIVNYFQHGTYLTVNHGHAALFGVYGNLAIAAMLFCGRWLIDPRRWAPRLLRTGFWSLNLGLALMVVLDLFPVGIHQLLAVMNESYAFARSQAYVQGATFQTLTWLRGIGATVFLVGGVLPITWFMVSRWGSLKAAAPATDPFVVPATVLAAAPGTPSEP